MIEMLVALAVFSLAALALLRLEGATMASTFTLDQKLMAQTVARNIAVETITDPAAPTFGKTSGEEVNGGQSWRWTRQTVRTADARVARVDIAVADDAGRTLAGLTVVRTLK
ncbi:general secretion pathway protein I [Sphingobium boeckii]|uniref:Type II secretion system protein I n=1 Tax=Sphingobium boeckii TaxID=1082345 RepID=A0A7W9AL34_9SPHN|nr:general secretion pathway protein I [Sphingobium boeckii]